MPDVPGSPADPYAHLRASAAARRQETVDRLTAGIAALAAAGRAVSGVTIRDVTGLDLTAIRRNPEAYQLFRAHSTHLLAQRAKQGRGHGQRRPPVGADTVAADEPAARDPLTSYSQARLIRLIHQLRRALAERATLEQQYRALVQAHMHCALTIERLREAALVAAEDRALLDNLRAKWRNEE